MNFVKFYLFFFLTTVSDLHVVIAQDASVYDLVLMGGRVIDPETALDTIKNVGIKNNRIAEISSLPLKGKEVLDVRGLVVSPGFIDLHVHGRSNIEQEYQLHDGITTALELEWGIEYLGEWYQSRKGKALINYGASVSWPFERFKALDKNSLRGKALRQLAQRGQSRLDSLFSVIGSSYTETPTLDQLKQVDENIIKSLRDGGIGIGIPIGYLPKTKSEEIYRIYKLAGEQNALVFSHVREPSILAIQEALANAMLTSAPLHIVHINSMALGQLDIAFEMLEKARKIGFDITTELYPYTAASTLLQSAVFNEGWQDRLDMSYSDLQWVATGERLTKETFDAYRKTTGAVIMHMMKPEWIKKGIVHPSVIIASDGMPYSPLAHPRTAGTFSRVLGKYVREDKSLTLNEALEKMTLLPAKRLEGMAPSMRFKGRLQVGADADITVFDPSSIKDMASFEKGLLFSTGIEYVIVNGALALRNGKTSTTVFQGQPIYGKFKKN